MGRLLTPLYRMAVAKVGKDTKLNALWTQTSKLRRMRIAATMAEAARVSAKKVDKDSN